MLFKRSVLGDEIASVEDKVMTTRTERRINQNVTPRFAFSVERKAGLVEMPPLSVQVISPASRCLLRWMARGSPSGTIQTQSRGHVKPLLSAFHWLPIQDRADDKLS